MAAIVISAFAGASASHAALVPAGSTVDISIYGFTGINAPGNSAILVGPIVGTFGGTYTYPGAAQGGQLTTISSSEFIAANSKYVDTITISVPTNFDVSNLKIAGLYFDLGEAIEALSGPTTQNGWQLSTAINPAFQLVAGSASSTANGVVIGLTPVSTFNGTNTALYAFEGFQILSRGDIASNGINSFTFTSTVLEPVSGGVAAVMASLGLLRTIEIITVFPCPPQY